MPRFESDERFWEIEREGRRLRIRSGRLGEPGELVNHVAHFEAEAKREFDRRISIKVEQGFLLVPAHDEPVSELDPTRAAMVLEALGTAPPVTAAGRAGLHAFWSVLGDWLAAHGDVRGELISIDESLHQQAHEQAHEQAHQQAHEQAERESPGEQLLARRQTLLAEWIPRWFGAHGQLVGCDAPIDFAWDHGFIIGARIGTDPSRLDLSRFRLGLRDLVPALEQLLAHPLALALRELEIGELDPHGRRDLARALAAIAKDRRPALTRLQLGGLTRGEWIRDEFGTPRQRMVLARIGSLAPLAEAGRWAPKLASLQIVGRELRDLPAVWQLQRIELMVPAFTHELREWLLHGEWPRLERLWLRSQFNDPWGQLGSGPSWDDLLDVFVPGSPLRELGVQGTTALAGCLAQLRERGPRRLSLRELRVFGLGDAGVDQLLADADALASVERIVIEDADIGPRFAELSRQFGPRLRRCAGVFASVESAEKA